MPENPILITGLYRSGTTIISRILDAHPELNVTFDSVNYFRFVVKKGIHPGRYLEIVESVAARLKERYAIVIDTRRIVEEIEKTFLVTHKIVYAAIMEGFFNYSGKRWGEKALLEWTSIPTFLSMFAGGKAIHIIRDPRDVLISYKRMTFETGCKYLDSVFAGLHSMNAALKYQTVLPPERYHLLKYEDFIHDKKESVKKLCAFLEINFTDLMLEEEKYTEVSGEKFDILSHSSFPEEVASQKTAPTGKWQETLTDFEIDFVESILAPQMLALGYALSKDGKMGHCGEFIRVMASEPLLKRRLIHFLETSDGVESYPSDPTDPENWGGTGIKGQGAAMAYGKAK